MRFEFIADLPVLDFVATVSERGTKERELLRTPDDLADWVVESGLVDDRPALTDGDLHRARRTREALFALVTALVEGTDPPREQLEIANRAAARPGPRLALGVDGRVRRSGDLTAVLAVLAAELIELHDSPDRLDLRWCDDPRCTRPFIDRSRGRRRRWCGMKGCGDRAKAAAYRRRRAADVSEPRP